MPVSRRMALCLRLPPLQRTGRTLLEPSLVTAAGRPSSYLRFFWCTGKRPPVLRCLCLLSREMPIFPERSQQEAQEIIANTRAISCQRPPVLYRPLPLRCCSPSPPCGGASTPHSPAAAACEFLRKQHTIQQKAINFNLFPGQPLLIHKTQKFIHSKTPLGQPSGHYASPL